MRRERIGRNVLVVSCHPQPTSFTAASLERVLTGLAASGRNVRLHDLYAEAWETAGDISTHSTELAWCDTLVLVYPTWWSGQPGMLADWIVRCWPAAIRRRHITHVVAVTSHGSPKYVNALEGEVGKHLLERWVRWRCARSARVEWIALYDIDTAGDERRRRFLDQVEQRFASRPR